MWPDDPYLKNDFSHESVGRYTDDDFKANTASDKNGILQVWVCENGGQQRLVVDRSDLRFGTKGRGNTDSLYVAPFHGGGDSSFAAEQTSYMLLDDFAVQTTKFSDLP